MALPERITKTDAAELLDITRDTLDKRIAEGGVTWPPESWAALHREAVAYALAGNVVPDSDDARFRRARADAHEIGAAKQRGEVLPVDVAEEVVVTIYSLTMQEQEGARARLLRSAGVTPLAEAINREFDSINDNLARSVERCCEDWEKRARGGTPGAEAPRRRVGARGADSAAGERGAGAV